MYELTVRGEFESAHQIVGCEGKCRRLHGHNRSVEAVVRGRVLDELNEPLLGSAVREDKRDV